jgi:DNA polymerase-3 subunit beta
MEGIDVVTRLVEGEYPAVRSVIPSEYNTRMVLDVQDIVRGVKLANPFAGENDSSTLYLDFSGEDPESILPGSLELTTRKSEIGGYKNSIKGITAGSANKIMVSNEFFLEALKSVGSQQVAIELTTGTKPLILKEVGHEGWTHVIMQKSPKGN